MKGFLEIESETAFHPSKIGHDLHSPSIYRANGLFGNCRVVCHFVTRCRWALLSYLTQGGFKVVLQKATPHKFRQVILYYYECKE